MKRLCMFSCPGMSEETTENETLGGVLMNGLGGSESPGVGVSGSKPLVNGDLREGDSEGEYEGRKTTVLTDTVGDNSTSSSTGKQREVPVKVSIVIRSTPLPVRGWISLGKALHIQLEWRRIWNYSGVACQDVFMK